MVTPFAFRNKPIMPLSPIATEDLQAHLPQGILPLQSLAALVDQGAVRSSDPLDDDQIQPASIDLRLGARAWRVRASYLPRGRKVSDRLIDVQMHEMDLSKGAVFEAGCVYIAELKESLNLPKGISARANPKSSTGRVDVFVRLLSDYGNYFDDVADGYSGPIYLEIAPQTFSVLARSGTRLNQLRLKRGTSPRLYTADCEVDLTGDLVGFRARRHAGIIDLDHVGGHDPKKYWEPLYQSGGQLLLDPGEFYILARRPTSRSRFCRRPRCCRSTPASASSASTMPAFSIRASARPRPKAWAPRACSRSVATKRLSSWRTVKPSHAWSMSR